LLGIDFERVPVVTCDQITHGKPDPDLFLTAAERLAVDIETSSVVGDSVWDIGICWRPGAPALWRLASGGYGREELERAAPVGSTKIRPTF
jgi:FMN phosphatase YigB (HAD superfamily)